MSQTSCCQRLKFCCSRQLGWMFVCCPQFSPGALPHGAAGCDGLGLDGHLAVSVQLDLCGGHLRPHLHPQMLERVREGILRNGVSVILVVVFFLTGLSLSVFTSPCLTSVWSIFPEVRLNGQYMSSKCPKNFFMLPACSFLCHQKVKVNVTWHILMWFVSRGTRSLEARRRRKWWSTGWEAWSWCCSSASCGSRCSSCLSSSLWLESWTAHWMFPSRSRWLAFRCVCRVFYQHAWAESSPPVGPQTCEEMR